MSLPVSTEKKRPFDAYQQSTGAVSAQAACQQARMSGNSSRPTAELQHPIGHAPSSLPPTLASEPQLRAILSQATQPGPITLLPTDLLRLIARSLDLSSFCYCRRLSKGFAAVLAGADIGPSRIHISRLPKNIEPLLNGLRTMYLHEVVLDSMSPLHAARFIELGIASLDWDSSRINAETAYSNPDLGDAIGKSTTLTSLKIGRRCDPGSGEALGEGLKRNQSLRRFECKWIFHTEVDHEGELTTHLIQASLQHLGLEDIEFRVRDTLRIACDALEPLRGKLRFEYSDLMDDDD